MKFCKHRVMDKCDKDDRPCIFSMECYEPEETKRQTNADLLNAMTIEEKAEFLEQIAYGRKTPWSDQFVKEFCDNCPTVHCTFENGIADDLHECDFVDGKCPHGNEIVWWLKQPYEETDHDKR